MSAAEPARFTTGLILALPELADFTSPWRSTSYAPDHPTLSIERRFPPHITLLTPWAEPTDTGAMARLRAVAAAHEPMDLEFREAHRFPDSTVVWLAPAPHPELDALLRDVLAAFPEYPPYEGLHLEPIPHVTVSADGDDDVLAQVRAALETVGPLRAPSTGISVYARDEDSVWRQANLVPLGAPTTD